MHQFSMVACFPGGEEKRADMRLKYLGLTTTFSPLYGNWESVKVTWRPRPLSYSSTSFA